MFHQGFWSLSVYPPSQARDERDGNRIQEGILLAGRKDPFCRSLVCYISISCPFQYYALTRTFFRDTVSSVGLIKGDVFVSTSASVTNASHFRHALALDECRVKFMPEYFREMNAHRNSMLRPNADSDIKEVWFSGCHTDVYVIYHYSNTRT